MKDIAGFSFPETAAEADAWKPHTDYRALHCKVLVAATTRREGTWKAYCSNVPGQCHDEEWQAVLRSGDPVLSFVAKAIFPEYEKLPYAR